jgi:hypothetical protein
MGAWGFETALAPPHRRSRIARNEGWAAGAAGNPDSSATRLLVATCARVMDRCPTNAHEGVTSVRHEPGCRLQRVERRDLKIGLGVGDDHGARRAVGERGEVSRAEPATIWAITTCCRIHG